MEQPEVEQFEFEIPLEEDFKNPSLLEDLLELIQKEYGARAAIELTKKNRRIICGQINKWDHLAWQSFVKGYMAAYRRYRRT